MTWDLNESRKKLPELGTLVIDLKQILTVQIGTPSASERE